MRHMSTMRDKAIVEIAHRILADRPMRMALTGKDKAAVGREGTCSLQHFDRLAGERQHEVEARIQLAVELQLHSRRGDRSEERRVGKEWVRRCGSRGCLY